MNYILKYPSILENSISDLSQKLDYLYETLNGDPSLVRQYPAYLNFNLNEHIRLRSEFLQAVGIPPLKLGLEFLLLAPNKEFAKSARIELNLFENFKSVYFDKLKKELRMKKELTKIQSTTSSEELNGAETSQDVQLRKSDAIANQAFKASLGRRTKEYFDNFKSQITRKLESNQYITVYDSSNAKIGSDDEILEILFELSEDLK